MQNEEQREFWSDKVGDIWVNRRAAMDIKLAPVLEALLERAAIREGEQILDIGCGAGTSSFEAAQRTGPKGHVIGADISETLLADARARATGYPNVRFDNCDAQTHDFAPESVDLIMSRFGVMFFADPPAAFVNMARALKPGGRMVFATWGSIGENPFFTMPAAVSKTVLGPRDRTDPDAPGPFALRDIDRVKGILNGAPLAEIKAEEVPVTLTPPGTAEDVAALMCQIGPAHSALNHFDADEAQRRALMEALIDALDPYVTAGGVCIPGLINMFSARKG
ncbi:class I SAM-dependent methyltransferase [Sulfitobacter sp. JB4-11]|uniref:class I SAM-dependent methyltransferase n=1 Tax=Sulfitobacter rhodophyticola TaxID=3238304 RepID=UPI003516B667